MVVVFFGWVIREGLRSTTGEVYIHPIIPPYALLLYAALAALVNRRAVVATRDGSLVTNGPIPLGHGRRWIPRDEIVSSWYVAITTVGDDGDTVVLWHDVGIETRAGRVVPTFASIDDAGEAGRAADRMARALGSASDWTAVAVRQVASAREDPAERRTVRRWIVVTCAAVVIGIACEIAHRAGAMR